MRRFGEKHVLEELFLIGAPRLGVGVDAGGDLRRDDKIADIIAWKCCSPNSLGLSV